MGHTPCHGDLLREAMVRLVSITGKITLKCISQKLHRVVAAPGSLILEEYHSRRSEKYTERQKQSKPLLDAFFEWLHSLEDAVDRSSKIGEAVLYTINQEQYLRRYLDDGH